LGERLKKLKDKIFRNSILNLGERLK
jgi:hypothetical protein